MEKIASQKCYEGWQNVYRHPSIACDCDMTFAVYFPPEAATQKVPVLWYLAGLTCNHDNAMTKANFQKYAAKYGMAIVYPDTSPRGENVANDEAYDLGQGAGFYVNATQKPWAPHFQMFDYINIELPALLEKEFPQIDMDRQGIFGHSMGGHGAIVSACHFPDRFTSLSAFAPICNPVASDWGRKQFSAYLGDDESLWAAYDASLLIGEKKWASDILIDQGLDDQFIALLRTETLCKAIGEKRQEATIRFHAGYDHSYFFIASFAEDHIKWHAQRLKQGEPQPI